MTDAAQAKAPTTAGAAASASRRARLATAAGFFFIICGAAAIRIYGLNFGFPFLVDIDEPEFSDRAFQIIASGDLNPHWFGHPGSLTIYSLAFAYWLFGAIGVALGWFKSFVDVAQQYWHEPSSFYFVGRLVMAGYGMLTVWLTYLVARRIADRWTALLAMAIVAVAPLSVEYSRLIRTDSQLAVCILVSLWFAMAAAEHGRWRDYLLAGFALGLGVATKYPGLVMAPVIGLAWLFDTGFSRRAWKQRFPRLAGAGLASLAGFCIGSPFLFLDIGTAISDIKSEGRGYHLSGTSDGFFSTLKWYLVDTLGNSLTIAGLVLALLGMVILLRSRRPQAVLVPVLFIIFLISLSALPLRWERWAVPLLPLAAILAAVGFSTVWRWASELRGPATVRSAFVAVLVLAWLATPSVRSFTRAKALASEHTSSMAWRWVMSHIEPGATFLVERYTPQLPRGRYAVLEVAPEGGQVVPVSDYGQAYLRPWAPLAGLDIGQMPDAGADYVMLGNDYDRRLAEGEREWDALRRYRAVMDCGELIYQADPVPGRVAGTTVRIYRMSRPPSVNLACGD